MTSGADDIDRWIAALDGNQAECTRAREHLIAIGAPAVEPLLQTMQTGRGQRAWQAAEVLGELHDPQSWQPLAAAVRSANPIVGSAAVKSLLRFADADPLPVLMEALQDAHPMTQQTIVLTLPRLGDRRAVPALMDCLTRVDSPTLRCGIIRALSRLGDPRAIPAVRACANDADRHVRDWVVVALKQLGEELDAVGHP